MPERARWPQGLVWGLHDFNLAGAQRLSAFQAMIDRNYGGAIDAAEWVALAQFVNYDGYRPCSKRRARTAWAPALDEHPCWPSFAWQTYDYYFDHTAAYYASKKACEPVHIQWNPRQTTSKW